jgi:2-polyprenyl-6-methoxyphenol hydroxylase-like FAD-dependent oxidoreductase
VHKSQSAKKKQFVGNNDPIPQILLATQEVHVSGYPVYDRELLHSELLKNAGKVTLIGDAAHPMSPRTKQSVARYFSFL